MILALFFAWLAEYKRRMRILMKSSKSNKWNIYVVLLVLLLSSVLGLRSGTVGLDTVGLERSMLPFLERGDFNGAYGSDIFKLFAQTTLLISGNSYTFFWFILALVTISLFIAWLWRFGDKISFPIAVLLFVTIYFQTTFNLHRQMLSIAIFLFGTTYFFQKKYLMFFIFIGLATAFHYIIIPTIVLFIIVSVFFNSRTEQKWIRRISVAIISIILVLYVYIIYSNMDGLTYLERYLREEAVGEIGAYQPFKFILLTILLASIWKRIQMNDRNILIYGVFAIIGSFMTFAGYLWPFAGRIALGLVVPELILVANVKNNTKYAVLIRWIIIPLSIIIYIVSINNGIHGIMPYYFFWQ